MESVSYDLKCSYVELRFEDATLAGSPCGHFCKKQDKRDPYDKSLIEILCNYDNCKICPVYNS